MVVFFTFIIVAKNKPGRLKFPTRGFLRDSETSSSPATKTCNQPSARNHNKPLLPDGGRTDLGVGRGRGDQLSDHLDVFVRSVLHGAARVTRGVHPIASLSRVSGALSLSFSVFCFCWCCYPRVSVAPSFSVSCFLLVFLPSDIYCHSHLKNTYSYQFTEVH